MRRAALPPGLVVALAAAAVAASPGAAMTTAPDHSPASESRARTDAKRVAGAFLVAHPGGAQTVILRARPGGKVLARLGSRTQFGSPVALGVVRQRGAWLGVVAPQLGNGRIGWTRARSVRIARTRVSLELDLSKRTLVLKHGDRAVRRMRVGVGRPGSPTPTGRFAVTDKLPGSRYGSYYGCCIVALSALQPNLPPGWTGGNRIAIHGTNNPSSIGRASSAGCPHASGADMRLLMRAVPLGAPVFVHA